MDSADEEEHVAEAETLAVEAHAAAVVDLSNKNPVKVVEPSVRGTHNVLASARKAETIRRFVHISTPSVYFRFNNQLNVRETQPLPRPVNAYAATKALGEQDVLAALDLDPVILRPRGLYGRGDTALLPRLMNTARKSPLPLMNAGQTVTDLTHVDDVVSAVHAALDVASTPTKRLFNISGGVPLNLKSVTEEAGRRAGVSVSWRPVPTWAALAVARSLEIVARLRPGQPEPKVTAYGIGLFAFSQTLDISAARDVLGWTPRIGIKEGLERTFEGGHAG